MGSSIRLTAGLALLSLTFVPSAALAQPGVTASEIKVGNTNPYSGPLSAHGTIGKSIGAYFKKVNDEGGINGRKINYISYDDQYSPPKTLEMTRKLVEQDQVALIFQPLGTPTNSAIWKYMNDQKVPQLFLATGATKFGDPQGHPWTMGWQPTYQTEGHIFAQYVLKNIPDAKVGVLYQNDDSGKDYLKGFKDGLGAAAARIIVMEQSYEVTDPTVDSQVVNLKNSGANVFFNGTAPKFASQAIRKAHDLGWKPVQILASVSASVQSVLKPAGFEAAKGIMSAQYLKDVTDPQWKNDPGFKGWMEFMQKYYPQGDINDPQNEIGISIAQTWVQVLKQAGNDLTRDNIRKQAANIQELQLPLLLPGIKLNTSATNYYPVTQQQLTKFDGKSWVRFGEVLSGS